MRRSSSQQCSPCLRIPTPRRRSQPAAGSDPSLDREMYHGNATGSVVGDIARNRLSLFRSKRTRQRGFTFEVGFEDAEIWRLARPQGLCVERVAGCLQARKLARKRHVRLDIVLPEMCGILRFIVKN